MNERRKYEEKYVPPHRKHKPGRTCMLDMKYVQDLLGDSDGMLQPHNFSSLVQDHSSWRNLVVTSSAAEWWWWWWLKSIETKYFTFYIIIITCAITSYLNKCFVYIQHGEMITLSYCKLPFSPFLKRNNDITWGKCILIYTITIWYKFLFAFAWTKSLGQTVDLISCMFVCLFICLWLYLSVVFNLGLK